MTLALNAIPFLQYFFFFHNHGFSDKVCATYFISIKLFVF